MIAEALQTDLVKIRRQLHRRPELGYAEFETAKLISDTLQLHQITHRTGVAKTGVIAEIKKGEGKCIVLRADMDALPMTEETGLEFKSEIAGKMHACGHDVHVTMLLGACILLKDKPFNGTIKFIFQPSEEGVYDDPENKSGGQRIVESGALDNADYALGLHVHPLLDAGILSYAPGEALACTNVFTIHVHGHAAHAGAAPQLGTDAILVASNLVMALNTIVSRNISPTTPGVISVTKISGGTAPNVVPDYVRIEGTTRSLDMDNYHEMMKRMNTIIEGMATTYNAKIELEMNMFYPSLLNDDAVHQKLLPVANKIFNNRVLRTPPLLGGEDFAFYSRKVPSMFYFIGAKDTGDKAYFVHDPKVVVNEDCIPLGAEFLADAAIELLK